MQVTTAPIATGSGRLLGIYARHVVGCNRCNNREASGRIDLSIFRPDQGLLPFLLKREDLPTAYSCSTLGGNLLEALGSERGRETWLVTMVRMVRVTLLTYAIDYQPRKALPQIHLAGFDTRPHPSYVTLLFVCSLMVALAHTH